MAARNAILSKRQDLPRENRADGSGDGRGRKCANLAGLRKCRMKAGSRFPRHFAARHGMPCGRTPPPRRPVRGKAGKRTDGFCTREASNQEENAARSPVFPRFPHSRKRLCGKKFASLRQETNFFQQRNSIFAAQKRPPGRRNAPYGRFSRPFLCTDAINRVSTVPLHGRGIRGKPSFLTGNSGICRQSVTGAAGDSVPLDFYSFPVCLV